MTDEDREQFDYIRSWRHDYDAARESRNAAIMLWVGVAVGLAIYAGVGFWDTLFLGVAFTFGGCALALIGHYQGVIHTYYQALKGTRDEPPRDELATRRRR